MRILLQALLILVPFIAYAIYLALVKRGESRGWNTAPWFWLTASGLALFVVSILLLGLVDEGGRRGTYVPPHLEGGKVVPAETR